MASTLHISLLGNFCVFDGDTPLTTLNTPRLQSLLAYLVLHRHAPQSRSHLAFCLWPDSTEAQARTNLRHLIHQLRQTLPCAADFMSADGSTVQWRLDSPFTLDVDEFERAYAAHDFDRAVKVYRGELLPECYDDWIMPERERLQQMFVTSLDQLVQQKEVAGDYVTAIEHARRLLRHDPLREETYCTLMRLYSLRGDRTGVVRIYEMCAAVVRQELGIEPSPGTRAAYTHYFAQSIASGQSTGYRRTPQADQRLSNLPRPLTRLIGREVEKSQVQELVMSHRMLTLIGAGGVGKTRLALAAVEELIDHFADGVWLVDLAPLSDPALVEQTLAAVLGVQAEGGCPLRDRLAAFVRDRQLLLVLDNCEHLVDAVRLLVEDLLQAAPHLRIMGTSRVVLSVPGEVIWRVPSLSVPEKKPCAADALSGGNGTSPAHDLSELLCYESVQFFADRAAAVLPTFTVNQQNVCAVVSICQQLDGIPLALELAAARVRVLTVQQIADRLNDALRLLTQNQLMASPRHRTLQAMLDWSYALLTQAEQKLFRGLAVFAGGATFEALEAVCGGDDVEEKQILDVLSGLVDKSLVNVESSGTTSRFWLHEVTRQYAAHRLQCSAEEYRQVKHRHCDYYAGFLQQREMREWGSRQKNAMAEVRVEIENARLAWKWAAHQRDAYHIKMVAPNLFLFYEAYGWLVEAESAFGQAAAALQFPGSPEYAAALGLVLAFQGRACLALSLITKGAALLRASVALLRTTTCQQEAAWVLNALGHAAHLVGNDVEAQALHEESLTLSRASGDRLNSVAALDYLGDLAATQGEYDRAQQYWQEGLDLSQESGDLRSIALMLACMGSAAHQQRAYDRAQQFYERSLAIYTDAGDQRGMAEGLNNLGSIALAIGNVVEAQQFYRRSLTLRKQIGHRWGQAYALIQLGRTSAAMQQTSEAKQLFLEGLASARETGHWWGILIALIELGNVTTARGEYDEAREYFHEALTKANAAPFALDALLGMAELLARTGERNAAVRLLAFTARQPALHCSAQDKAEHLVQTLFDARDSAAARAWQEGKSLTLAEAIAYALKKSALEFAR
jgi:predicted ATPase